MLHLKSNFKEKVDNMNFIKAYLFSIVYYIIIFSLIFIYQFGIEYIITMIFYQVIYLSVIVIILNLILEQIVIFKGYSKLYVIFTGFLFGILISILFGGYNTNNLEILYNLLLGVIFSVGSLIFTSIRSKKKIKR